MKNLIIVFVTLIMVAGTTTLVRAQKEVKGTAQAGANIVAALSISSDVKLDFGSMSIPNDNVSVILSTANARTVDKATNISLLPGTTTNARVKVKGAGGLGYTIKLPDNGTVTITNGTTTMAIDEFQSLTPFSSSNGLAGKLDASGNDEFVVGATLKVLKDQSVGVYTGSFEVMVTYN
jgi:hypothetical protein